MAQALEALRELPESSHLALLAPRFMLRHPYGKRAIRSAPSRSRSSRPRKACAACCGAIRRCSRRPCWRRRAGRTLSVGDLPFHYVVDGDGDQVALPTTERLINLAAAEMLRRVGIDALMAHKGQPELRIAGLDTVNGSPMAACPAWPSRPPG